MPAAGQKSSSRHQNSQSTAITRHMILPNTKPQRLYLKVGDKRL